MNNCTFALSLVHSCFVYIYGIWIKHKRATAASRSHLPSTRKKSGLLLKYHQFVDRSAYFTRRSRERGWYAKVKLNDNDERRKPIVVVLHTCICIICIRCRRSHSFPITFSPNSSVCYQRRCRYDILKEWEKRIISKMGKEAGGTDTLPPQQQRRMHT